MRETKNDIKWKHNFDNYKDYVIKHGRLPKVAEIWNEIPIGTWLRNQRKLLNEGKLDRKRMRLMDSFKLLWRADTYKIVEYRNVIETQKILKQNESIRSTERTPLTDMVNVSPDIIKRAIDKGLNCCEAIVRAKHEDNYKIFSNAASSIELLAAHAIHKNVSKPTLLLLKYITGNFNISSIEINMHNIDNRILEVLTEIPAREAEIVKLYFGYTDGIPHKLIELGKQYGITKSRASQIIIRAIKKLKQPNRYKKMMQS